MPLYEYLCDACGHRFETIRKFSDPPLEACPRCAGKVQKLVSSPAFQFKGSGWYATDYAKKSESGKGGGASEKSEKSEKGESSTSESKDKSSTDSSAKSTSSSESTSKDSSTSSTTKPS